MVKALAHETIVLLVLLLVAVVVFIETQGLDAAPPGQVAPATIPRLAAGALALLAVTKLLLNFWRPLALQANDYDWSWANIRKPVFATALMFGYLFLFRIVPFPALTAFFVFAIFWVFGVRPLSRLVVGTVIATVVLCGLFIFLMRIPL